MDGMESGQETAQGDPNINSIKTLVTNELGNLGRQSSKFHIGHHGALSQSKALSSSKYLIGHLGGAFRKHEFRRLSYSKFHIGHRGAFGRADKLKRFFLFEVPYVRARSPFLFEVLYWASWVFSQSRRIQTPFFFETCYRSSWGEGGVFAKQTSSTTFLLEVPSWGFSQTNSNALLLLLRNLLSIISGEGGFAKQTSSMPFLLEVPCWASWGFSQTNSNALLLRNLLSGILGVGGGGGFAAQRLSYSKFHIGHRGASRRADELKRPSSSKLAIGHLGGGFRRADELNAFPTRSSILGIVGLLAEQTNSNALLLRNLLSGILGGSFRRTDELNAFPTRSSILGIVGLLAEQTKSNALPLRSLLRAQRLSYSKFHIGHRGASRRADEIKRTSSSKLAIGHLGEGFRIADELNAFPTRSSILGIVGLLAEQTKSNALPLRSLLSGILGRGFA